MGLAGVGDPQAPEAPRRAPSSSPKGGRSVVIEEDTSKQKAPSRDDVVRQLQLVVRAQHGKIEELRTLLAGPTHGVAASIAQHEREEIQRLEKENADYRLAVHALKAELQKARRDNDTLRRANRRLKEMLHTVGGGASPGPSLLLPALPGGGGAPGSTSVSQGTGSVFQGSGSVFQGTGGSTSQGGGCSQLRCLGDSISQSGGGSHSRALGDSPDVVQTLQANILEEREGEPVRRSPRFAVEEPPEVLEHMATESSGPRSGPMDRSLSTASNATGMRSRMSIARGSICQPAIAVSRMSRLLSLLPSLWRDVETPCAILRALTEVCMRVLGDFPGVTLTVYGLDPWIRAALSEDLAGKAPVLFFLGQGKLQLQAMASRSKIDAPCFPGLQALPYQSRSALAISVPIRDRHLAVLQAQMIAPTSEDDRAEKSEMEGRRSSMVARQSVVSAAGAAPRVLQGMASTVGEQDQPVFNERVKELMQLTCFVAGGLLAQVERAQQGQRSMGKLHTCMDIAIEVNKALSLHDFEQRTKHLLGDLFNVTSVRVLYYSEEQKQLFASPQTSRQESASFSLDKGVVGLVSRKLQVLHIPDISKNAFVDHFADGMQRPGRPMDSHASMLLGPLVFEPPVGSGGKTRLLGVVQVMERRRRPPAAQVGIGGASPDAISGPTYGEFTSEEQSLFGIMLRILAVVVLKIWKAQELSAKHEGSPCSLAYLLCSK